MNDLDTPLTREEVRREMQRFGEQLITELVKAMTGRDVPIPAAGAGDDDDGSNAGPQLRRIRRRLRREAT